MNKVEVFVVPLPDNDIYSLQVKFQYDQWSFVEKWRPLFKDMGFDWQKDIKSWVMNDEKKYLKKIIIGLKETIPAENLSVIRMSASKGIVSAKDLKVDYSKLSDSEYSFLRPFQQHPVLIFKEKQRLLLAFDLGLGKTVTSASMIRNQDAGAIIVATKSLIKQWRREIKKWFPDDIVVILEGKKKDRLFILERAIKANVRWIITNYEFVRDGFVKSEMLPDRKTPKLSLNIQGLNKYAQIYDEMYKIKNYKSKMTKHCTYFSKQSQMIVGLTGTPMENNLYEFYTIINFIKPNTIAYMEMENRFVKRGYFGSTEGYKNLDQFHQRVNPHMVRVNKKDVIEDLPPFEQEFIFVDTEHAFKGLVDELMEKAESIFEVYTVLRMIDSQIAELNPNATYYDEVIPYIHIVNEAKMEKLVELMSEIGNNQVLIFSFFKGATKFIKETLKEEFNIDVQIVTGDTNDKKADEIEEKFIAGDVQVVAATDTWAYGKDFPEVDYLINWDLLPNPAKMYQRVNRIYRMNSTNGKQVYNLVGNVVEHDVYDIIKDKLSNIEQAVEGTSTVDVLNALSEKYGIPVKSKGAV